MNKNYKILIITALISIIFLAKNIKSKPYRIGIISMAVVLMTNVLSSHLLFQHRNFGPIATYLLLGEELAEKLETHLG